MKIQTKRNLLRAATAAAVFCAAAVVFLPATTMADVRDIVAPPAVSAPHLVVGTNLTADLVISSTRVR